jgi:hypothetical protein
METVSGLKTLPEINITVSASSMDYSGTRTLSIHDFVQTITAMQQ